MSATLMKRARRVRATEDTVLRAVIGTHTPSAQRCGIVAAERAIMAANPAAAPHPLGPPTVSGTTITVDLMLQQPTRITKMIMDLTLQRFLADKVFASAGGVSGGAVVYDEAILNELYTARDVERIEPGDEYPIITSERGQPKVAPVEKWGGRVWISDEARDRNNSAAFTNQVRQLANTVVRKLNQRAIGVLDASITASGQTAVGRSWGTYAASTMTTAAFNGGPLRDFALAQQLAEQQELGVTYTLWIINPVEYTNLLVGAGGPANFRAILQAMNIDIYVSNRVAAGTAYVVAGTSTGEMRVEQPLATVTYREEGRDRTWVKTGVRPVMYVTNPYSVIKFTGLT